MPEKIIGSEPNALTAPVRTSIDGSIQTAFPSLNELRADMVIHDEAIIDGIAARRIALGEILAWEGVIHDNTARSAAVARAIELHPDVPELPELVGAVYSEVAREPSPALPYDEAVVDAVAGRLRDVVQATLFKLNLSEGLAPEQQVRNRAKAMEMAMSRHPTDKGLPGVIERLYAVLVPRSVAIQQTKFPLTRLLSEM